MVILKKFLKKRNLDNCQNGGLSTYGLFLLLVFHLRKTQDKDYDLGQNLTTFLEYFGHLKLLDIGIDLSKQ